MIKLFQRFFTPSVNENNLVKQNSSNSEYAALLKYQYENNEKAIEKTQLAITAAFTNLKRHDDVVAIKKISELEKKYELLCIDSAKMKSKLRKLEQPSIMVAACRK